MAATAPTRCPVGPGNDIFYYDNVVQSTTGASDQITEFRSGDQIDLHAIDAIAGGADDAFTFIGAGAFTGHAGELRAENTAGSDWTIQADTDGNGTADLQILVHVADNHTITATDFVI